MPKGVLGPDPPKSKVYHPAAPWQQNRSNGSSSAGFELDKHRLAQSGRQHTGHGPGGQVVRTSRPRKDDQADVWWETPCAYAKRNPERVRVITLKHTNTFCPVLFFIMVLLLLETN